MNDYCYSNIIEDTNNKELLDAIKNYANTKQKQVYVLNKPLTDFKYSYNFKDGIIILEASKKICFVNLGEDSEAFDNYCEDVLEDIYSISDNYSYKELVERKRTWDSIIVKKAKTEITNFFNFIELQSITEPKSKRKQEILLSLFIGSINDIEKIGNLDIPESLLDKVKHKIQLFDTQQTRFIYQELNTRNKRITIQGMSGTGKTELLLHKCKDLYISNPNNIIGFTCFNKVLSSELKHRIPEFFDRMNANKQINPKRLMIVRAWGSYGDEYSGIYRYICHYYDIPFLSYRDCPSFDSACNLAIQAIKKKMGDLENKFAYTYMFIDESQDFSPSFFDLCELVTEKNLFIAGDIFQSIFETRPLTDMKPNFLLSNCYRTDPKTFMFAHALGLGLFEAQKLKWLQNNEWELCGYQIEEKIEEKRNCLVLKREPIRRFEDIDPNYNSLIIQQDNSYANYIISEISKLKQEYPTLCPEDVAIIYIDIDDDDYIYKQAPMMQIAIQKMIGWNSNLAYETKDKKTGEVFISNRNNVKGLEFPFVFCISRKISKQPLYRNILYTVLTRSFLKSYLILPKNYNNGLTHDMLKGGEEIMKKHKMTIVIPTNEEQKKMEKWFLNAEQAKSLDERLDEIFESKGITNLEHRRRIKESVVANLSPDTNDNDLSSMVVLFSKNMKR